MSLVGIDVTLPRFLIPLLHLSHEAHDISSNNRSTRVSSLFFKVTDYGAGTTQKRVGQKQKKKKDTK